MMGKGITFFISEVKNAEMNTEGGTAVEGE
jgi:hypothetical protein